MAITACQVRLNKLQKKEAIQRKQDLRNALPVLNKEDIRRWEIGSKISKKLNFCTHSPLQISFVVP